MSEDVSWANPEPWGLMALGGVSLILFGLFTGFIPNADHAAVILFPIGIAGAIAQTLTGIILLKRGDVIAGNLFAVFGNLFMITPTFSTYLMEVKGLLLHTAIGWWTIFLGIILWVWSIPMLRVPWVTWLVGPFAGFAFVSRGLSIVLHIQLLTRLAGWIFLIFFFWSLWNTLHALGEAVDMHFPVGKPLLPQKRNTK